MATSRKADEACFSNNRIHEVFLSFRGEDTRNNFTGHLYLALKEAGINAFIDGNELNRGEIINKELVQAIQGSKISIIVFSRRYADSSWCLEELVKIMECRTTLGQLVFPVFYDVDPSDVRKQSGTFEEAFDQKHGDKDEDKVKRWRAALTDAANLSGWDLRTKADGHEGKFVRIIIQEISKILNNTDLKVAENETGIESRVQDIVSLLGVGTAHDVRIVGICGMGGIGKTTVAKALFNEFRQGFEASSFLSDVRETMQNNGMVRLQETLLSDICKTSMTEVGLVDRGRNVIKSRLRCRRVFIVIDDVDQVEQLKALAIYHDSFGLGSRVLITTRDEHLLEQVGVDSIYQARLMGTEEALRLFSLHAFKTHCPPNDEYLKLSRRVVDCCGGLPLALKVLGCFLVERSTEFWESEIKKLQTILPFEIQEKLKISFDGLNDDTERDIFLDISCFHIGKEMDDVKQILASCALFPDSGIKILIQRCLITVNEKNKLMMHDLVRDMGREIIRSKCPNNPGKWSRVWHREDAIEVLRDESGSDKVQGFTLDMRWVNEKMPKLRTEAFAKMKRLRFLVLEYVKLKGGFKHLPNKLSWLCWTGFPLKFIPKDFSLGVAVAIYLQYSKLRHVWKDARVLTKLKILDLSHSYSLKQSPDFSTIPNLEKLVLKKCLQLTKVHHSIGGLQRLSLLNLEGCRIIKELPRSFYKMKSVETLLLNGCSRFEKLGEDIGDMTSLSTLCADRTAITELPSSIVRLKNLRYVSLRTSSPFVGSKNRGCLSLGLRSSWDYRSMTPNLILPHSVQGLSSIVELRICYRNITNVPEDLGSLSSLKRLNITGCIWKSLPSLSGLSQLVYLYLADCNLTDELIKGLNLGSLSSLEWLNLHGNKFSSLPSLRSLSKLETLCLSSCTNLVAIPDLPTSLTTLRATDCIALEVMPDFSDMCNLTEIYLRSCSKLDEILGLDESLKSSIRLLEMIECTNMTAAYKNKILQGWNFVGPGGIFLPPSDIPEWFTWVNEGDRLNFQVPEITGSNVMAFTLCFSFVKKEEDPGHCLEILVTNRTKLTTFSLNLGYEMCYHFHKYLWLGHLPNYRFNLEGGDLVEVRIKNSNAYCTVKKSGVSIVWDTKLPDFRIDMDRVARMCSSRPFTRGNNIME